jgi:hypothetical protein
LENEIMIVDKKKSLFAIALVGIIAVSACSPSQPATPTQDPQQIYTMVAETIQANIAETEAAKPTATSTPEATATPAATDTPQPTETPNPTDQAAQATTAAQPTTAPAQPADSNLTAGNHAAWTFQTVSDGATFAPSEQFTLVFGVKNVGTTTWTTGYSLRWLAGTQIWGNTVLNLDHEVKPGEKAEFYIHGVAPDKSGKYTTRWYMVDNANHSFYEVYLNFNVK